MTYNKAAARRKAHANDIRMNVADEVLTGLNRVQTNSFVRSLSIISKSKCPTIILYEDEQIQLIRSFCFSNTGGSVSSFDKTYNLGRIFVNTTAFSNKALVRRTSGDEPIFFGSIFLHATSEFDMFAHFLSHLEIVLTDSDVSTLRLGSDKELALRKAMHHTFPEAQQLVCMRHVKENMKRYMQDKVEVDSKNLAKSIWKWRVTVSH